MDAWQKAEQAYSDRGFRTLSVDAFIDSGKWGSTLEGLYKLREPDEEAVFHAVYYRENYLGKVAPMIQMNWSKLSAGESVSGQYEVPTTEHLLKNR